jgi:small subunit ribosomal protein S3
VPKKDFAKYLNQDTKARAHVESKFRNGAVIGDVRIERSGDEITVTVHTSKPGVVIGRGGSNSQEMVKEIAKNRNWTSYESVAAWYLWKNLDNKS